VVSDETKKGSSINMKKLFGAIKFIVLSIPLLFALVSSPLVMAATASKTTATKPNPYPNQISSNGLQITPIRTFMTIPAGTSQTLPVSVHNLTTDTGPIEPVVDDFVAGNNENGVPDILLNGQTAPSHSLKGYVQPMKVFNLQAKGTYNISVVISIPKGTPAGGYYGAIRFLPYNANNPSASKNVALTGSVASLILVTVPGPVHEELSISSFDVRKLVTPPDVFSSPGWLFENNKSLYGVVRFNNLGDLQEQPFGKIILKKGNTVIESSQINQSVPAGSVLPGSIRQFYLKLNGLGSFGKYTILGNFGYGTTGQLLSDDYSFYIIPLWVFVTAGGAIILILFLIFVLPRLLRRYNRRVLRQSNRSRW
jgi:hypothetical protein